MPTVARIWCMKQQFQGAPKLEDFEVKEETLPDLKDGEFLAEAVVWSVDPYNRAYSRMLPDGAPMIGFQIAKVAESKHTDFSVGDLVVNHLGWRTHFISSGKDAGQMFQCFKIPEALLKVHPLTYFVGVLGMPGATAYFGVLEKLKPQNGETLVVNAAAGAVGSLVGQIGKIMDLNVVGYAGSSEKVKLLTEIGFDHAFNYKTESIADTLKQAAPKGVDCFFDNVGYDFEVTVMKAMNAHGRICQCGAIAGYNSIEPKSVLFPYMDLIGKDITMSGFLVSFYFHRFEEFLQKMSGWITEKKIAVHETKYSGFKTMPQALIDVLSGKTQGKGVIEK